MSLLPSLPKLTITFILMLGFLPAMSQRPQAITIQSEKTLIPEGIAVDAISGTIYVSSIAKHKIIAIDKNGKHRQFINESGSGYLEGLGMKTDPKRKLLWTLSNKKEGKVYTSKIIAFDLRKGNVRFECSISDTIPRLFNDLTIDSSGNIYFTDTYYSAVLSVSAGQKNITEVAKGKEVAYPNGITMGKGNLYVATYGNGPIRINPLTRQVVFLPGFSDTTMAHGLDGLIYWNNTLIGVYNTGGKRTTNAIIQYVLNENGDRIIEERIIDKGNPNFKEPTTLDIADDTLYVVANSHLYNYNANKESIKGIENQLSPLVILKYKLKR